MLKYYFRFFLLVGCVIGFFALIGSLLPRSYDFTCEIEIAAPAERIFGEINQLQNWQTWTTWNPAEVEGLSVACTGEPGVGCAMTWTDPRGSGKLWIVRSERPQRIDYLTRFGNFPEMESSILLIPEMANENGEVTRVKWNSRGRLPGGPFYGFWASQFSGHMQQQYQRWLEKLKAKMEALEALPAASQPKDQGNTAE